MSRQIFVRQPQFLKRIAEIVRWVGRRLLRVARIPATQAAGYPTVEVAGRGNQVKLAALCRATDLIAPCSSHTGVAVLPSN